ncbi:MAG: hypothetical protein AAGH65_02500, partial [Pseudomonadota bacterium]
MRLAQAVLTGLIAWLALVLILLISLDRVTLASQAHLYAQLMDQLEDQLIDVREWRIRSELDDYLLDLPSRDWASGADFINSYQDVIRDALAEAAPQTRQYSLLQARLALTGETQEHPVKAPEWLFELVFSEVPEHWHDRIESWFRLHLDGIDLIEGDLVESIAADDWLAWIEDEEQLIDDREDCLALRD